MARRTRRRFLHVSLTGLTIGLAGCGFPGGGGEEGGEGGEDGGEEGGEEGGEGEEGDDRDPPAAGPGA